MHGRNCACQCAYVFVTCKFSSPHKWMCVGLSMSVLCGFALSYTVLLQAADWQPVASVAENPWPSSLTFTLTAVSLMLIYFDANLISAHWPRRSVLLLPSRGLGWGSLGWSRCCTLGKWHIFVFSVLAHKCTWSKWKWFSSCSAGIRSTVKILNKFEVVNNRLHCGWAKMITLQWLLLCFPVVPVCIHM